MFWEQLLFLDDQNYGGIQVQGALFEDQQDAGGGGDAVGEANDAKKSSAGSGDEDEDSDSDGEEEALDEGDSEGLQDSEEEEEEEEEGKEGGEGGRRERRLRRLKSKRASAKKTSPEVMGVESVVETGGGEGLLVPYLCGYCMITVQ